MEKEDPVFPWGALIGATTITGSAAIMGIGLSAAIMGGLPPSKSNIKKEASYLYPTKPALTMSIDVNNDGLEDIVGKDGRVEIKQKDGSYIPLKEYLGKVEFFYISETKRNSMDNLDYRVNTGRHNLVSQ